MLQNSLFYFQKLTKSHSEDSGFLLNREKSKTRFLPKTKKTTKKLKRTKRAQSSDDDIDHDAFKVIGHSHSHRTSSNASPSEDCSLQYQFLH